MPELDPEVLLAQHRPVIQYDSLESYYADSAAVVTDRPGNALRRADGTVVAGAGGVVELRLATLGPRNYADGSAVLPGDYLDEVGKDYRNQAREMHARPGYANLVHGRCVTQDGVQWLQYWLFMYYDDPGLLRLGCHEGDIEMIQIRIGPSGLPDAVSYAQHRSGVRASWPQVEREGDAPVIYSARGSHASMFRAGTSWSWKRSPIPDHNDGLGLRVRPELVTLSAAGTPWALWPGTWGSTRPDSKLLGPAGIEAMSPASLPSRQQWGDPAGFHGRCAETELPPPGQAVAAALAAPAAPQLTVHPDPAHGVATVRYKLPQQPGAPAASRLVLGVDSSADSLPPMTTTIPVEGPVGEAELPMPAELESLQIRATAHSEDGVPSRTVMAGHG